MMRAKRSKDARLVEKFGKQKESLAAEAPQQQPVCSAATDDGRTALTVGDDDDDDDELKVRSFLKKKTVLIYETVCIIGLEMDLSGLGGYYDADNHF